MRHSNSSALAVEVGMTVGAAQFVHPQECQTGGETDKDDGVCGAHGNFHAAAVVFICHPVLHLLLSLFHLFLVHRGYDSAGRVLTQ